MAVLTKETTDNGVLIATLIESRIMDAIRIEQLGKEMLMLVGEAESDRLVIDLRNVEFIGSSMVGKLVLLVRKCESAGVVIKVCNVSDNVSELFQLTKFGRLPVQVVKDRETAIAAFDKKSWFGFGR